MGTKTNKFHKQFDGGVTYQRSVRSRYNQQVPGVATPKTSGHGKIRASPNIGWNT
jgi:hypothetical protein